tara:strand:+ start:354 stop:464 length:111 start_codon:yes stop_codon:yes gene_type:complete
MFKMAILSKGIRLYYGYFKELDLNILKKLHTLFTTF